MMQHFINPLLLFFGAFPVLFATAHDSNSSNTCQILGIDFHAATFTPSSPQYPLLSEENWSQTAWKKPHCIVQPANTGDLQKVVRILTSNKVQFAIRGGGHSPSPGAANIENGILIDLSKFDDVKYDAKRHEVVVGAGQKWINLYEHLDRHNITVAGGRVLDVGVGGLTLGCGLSYLSDLYGLVCDNIVNFEVIVVNGSIVNANTKCNQDLFWALKGGLNNYGIVTSFTMSTYSINQVWGGIKFYSLEHLPALMSAAYEYQSVANKDPYANLMLQAFTTNATIGAVLNMVYLKPEASPPAFAPFYSIPTREDTTKIQTLTEFLKGQMIPPLPRFDWFATSFTPSASLYQKVANITLTAPELHNLTSLTAGSLALGLQPISSSLVRSSTFPAFPPSYFSHSRGGNPLSLSPVNQTWFVLDAGWYHAHDDSAAHEATKAVLARVKNAAEGEGNALEYVFMNDASYDQDVIGSYGKESVEKMQAVLSKWDPEGVWAKLVPGGFKVPKGGQREVY